MLRSNVKRRSVERRNGVYREERRSVLMKSVKNRNVVRRSAERMGVVRRRNVVRRMNREED